MYWNQTLTSYHKTLQRRQGCLSLSRVYLAKKRFLDRGFNLPEAKSDLAWINRNTTLVATDFGKGTLSSSGYPRIVKLWKRGQSLDNAKMLFEGESKDVGSWPFTLRNIENTYVLVRRSKTFYKGEYHLLVGNDLQKLNLPDDSRIADIFDNLLLVQLKSDWTVAGKTLSQGALISLPLDELVIVSLGHGSSMLRMLTLQSAQ